MKQTLSARSSANWTLTLILCFMIFNFLFVTLFCTALSVRAHVGRAVLLLGLTTTTTRLLTTTTKTNAKTIIAAMRSNTGHAAKSHKNYQKNCLSLGDVFLDQNVFSRLFSTLFMCKCFPETSTTWEPTTTSEAATSYSHGSTYSTSSACRTGCWVVLSLVKSIATAYLGLMYWLNYMYTARHNKKKQIYFITTWERLNHF